MNPSMARIIGMSSTSQGTQAKICFIQNRGKRIRGWDITKRGFVFVLGFRVAN